MSKPDTSHVLAGLKDFQRRTVDHVFDRFYGSDSTRRFLVADEVGLGKTLVAKGIIARVIEHLWDRPDPPERIEIIYICSNADIARQNVDRLHIENCGIEKMPATRLSLLPLVKRKPGKKEVNIIALTPGTSFQLTGGKGWARERALLYLMLCDAWDLGSDKPPRLVLAAAGEEQHGEKSFAYELDRLKDDTLDPEITRRFNKQMRAKEAKPLLAEFDELCEIFHRSNAVVSHEDRLKRHHWIGKLRTELTRVCIKSLQPSLIIMDEFQRFRDLLDEETPEGQLAAALFGDEQGTDADGPRTLLLSATPYKMLSMNHEQGEDHYRDLLNTLEFLDGHENPSEWEALFRAYQQSMLRLNAEQPEQSQILIQHRDELARHLRRVMVRTERLAESAERAGMLCERELGANEIRHPATEKLPEGQLHLAVERQTGKSARPTLGVRIEVEDVRAWLALQAIADKLEQGDCIEYWKSAPYVLNFMDRYQLSKAFHDAAASADSGYDIKKLVAKHAQSFLPIERVENYKDVPPANARLRALQRETLDTDAWKLLWVPPSLPHYQLAGPFAHPSAGTFTKSLIFSAWHVVPKAVSALLSYEAERRMMRFAKPNGRLLNSKAERKRGPLRFSQSKGRCTRLPLFCLVYPSLVLAQIGDPARLLREIGKPMPSLKEMLAVVEQRLSDVLAPLLQGKTQHGPEDERWYWLAPMLLDQTQWSEATSCWWSHPTLATDWLPPRKKEDESTHQKAWDKHLAEAKELLGKPESLGRPPADLAKLLAQVAIASPAVCALRAFARVGGAQDENTRLAAGRVGHAFLSLFNIQEVRALLLGLRKEGSYWRRVLDYTGDGGLQAVLDEFAHLLREDREKSAVDLSAEICKVMRLQATTLRADHITAPTGKRRVAINQPRDGQSQDAESEDAAHRGFGMRARFARRFGDDRGETEKSGNTKEAIRNAFNSPFWPFVLVSTSVGQEGLDFHRYCHRVIHWNLPSNPVDLEQREGRVHRYKGHAVRKNLSQRHREDALMSDGNDLWQALFEAGAKSRSPGESELFPYWLFPGEAKIERCVPMLPLSREIQRLHALRRALTVYRMAFGHARQEDVLEHLLARVPQERREELCAMLQIDLSPQRQELSP